MQRAINTITEEVAFSMWFAYIHCWPRDMLSMGPPQDYISSPVVNQKARIRMEQVLGSQGKRVRLKIECQLL
jgi:hypothetical protein